MSKPVYSLSMKTLFIIPLVLVSLVSFPCWGNEFRPCSEQEMSDVWLGSNESGPLNYRERFCLVSKTTNFIEEVFAKNMLPLTPNELEWVKREFDYLSNGESEARKNNFLNHELRFKYELFNNINRAKENLGLIRLAITQKNDHLEMQFWANLVANLIAQDLHGHYWQLVQRGLIDQHPKAGVWDHIILPDLLVKGIVLKDG